jgi:5-methyltetrahydropteroyltriglutamate--homocysteine methyltransferase
VPQRIETTHVGSLIRPPELAEILDAKEHGRAYDEARFESVLRGAVLEVVRQQVEVGVDIVSDGEFGKSISWSRYVRERLGGFETRADEPGTPLVVAPGTDKRLFPEFYAEYESTQGLVGTLGNWVCTGPVDYVGHEALGRDIENLKAAIDAVGVTDAFLPVVAPASVVPWRRDEYYASEEEFVFAVAEALAEEYRTIVDAGLIVQIDDAYLATMYDTMVPPASMDEYRAWAELRTEALIRALEGIPPERSRYHVCWGSWNAPHVGDVALEDIVDLILRVPVGAYALEQANPRHEHEWRVWERVRLPDGRKLIPGVISHATNVVEHPELVAERLVRLAKLVGPDNVVAGTDCGFAQGPLVRRVHPSIMWAKLRALADGARLASSQLWGPGSAAKKRMTSELLLVGSIPLRTVGEVFDACEPIAPFLSSVPDGEVGGRRFWTPYLPLRTFSEHPDLIELSRPAWAAFLEDERRELPDDGDVNEHWPFRIKPGVTELDLGSLHYAGPAIDAYAELRKRRDRGALPADLSFQVGIPSTDSVIEDYFPDQSDWRLAKEAYRVSASREIDEMLAAIPAEDLVVQWDLAVEPVNIELGANPWLSGASGKLDAGATLDDRFAHHMVSINQLWQGVPEPVRLGYHWCYGTWGGWPMTELRDLGLCVRLANAVVAGAGRTVDYIHMPVIADPDEQFFAPLADLNIGSARLYLGLIHPGDSDPGPFDRRVALAQRYVGDFGIAGVCGFGRFRDTEVESIFRSHLACARRLRELNAA